MLVADCKQTRKPDPRERTAAPVAAALPAWAGRQGDWRPSPPPAEPALPVPLAPSRPDDVAFGPVPRALSPRTAVDRFGRGTLVHELLQHMPTLPASAWERAALAHLSRHGLEPEEVATLVAQTLSVLRHPDLASLFGPGSRAEQPITGLIGGAVITGTVDRLVVLPTQVLLADYKTGRDAPSAVADTPVLYLRQLAAYRAVLQAVYPERAIHCALVWTSGATVVSLPPALLDAHAPKA
jgi:ATP-dependent helicase/nuclease subunit A